MPFYDIFAYSNTFISSYSFHLNVIVKTPKTRIHLSFPKHYLQAIGSLLPFTCRKRRLSKAVHRLKSQIPRTLLRQVWPSKSKAIVAQRKPKFWSWWRHNMGERFSTGRSLVQPDTAISVKLRQQRFSNVAEGTKQVIKTSNKVHVVKITPIFFDSWSPVCNVNSPESSTFVTIDQFLQKLWAMFNIRFLWLVKCRMKLLHCFTAMQWVPENGLVI
jgi:hypothetical protein